MTPRQRRGVLLLVLAAAGAILVFSAVSSYVDDVKEEVEPKTTVLVLTRNVPELEPIPPDAVGRREVPQKYANKLARRDVAQIGPRVPSTGLPAGTELQEGMLIEPPVLQEGEQEISILINADTGVAGKLRPGDLVDVLATFPPDDNTRSPASARTMIRRARIITVGAPTAGNGRQPEGGRQNAAAAAPASVTIPVTFALRPTLALRLTYAETFANEIRLSLQRRGDESRRLPRNKREFTLPPTRQRARQAPPQDDRQ